MDNNNKDDQLAIKVANLNFDYGGSTKVLFDINMSLEKGSRVLLVGANGTGKSTLLRILAGKHFVPEDSVIILGQPAFHKTPKGISFLGGQWLKPNGTPYIADISVTELVAASEEANLYKERCAKLMDLLDINPDWRMHEVSDGQRRRVQILLGLMKPFTLLLLDEVTVDLDVVVRKNLLDFLLSETDNEKATIVYATHIFDGLNEWPTHIAHLSNGRIKLIDRMINLTEFEELKQDRSTFNSPLLRLIERWVRREVDERKKLNIENKSQAQAVQPSKYLKSMAYSTKTDRFYNYWG